MSRFADAEEDETVAVLVTPVTAMGETYEPNVEATQVDIEEEEEVEIEGVPTPVDPVPVVVPGGSSWAKIAALDEPVDGPLVWAGPGMGPGGMHGDIANKDSIGEEEVQGGDGAGADVDGMGAQGGKKVSFAGEENLLERLVVDSGALIKGANLRDMAKTFYTVPEVVQEIKDRHSRKQMRLMPDELVVREPSAEAVAAVANFARKTGDFAALSVADLKVIALTWQYEYEFNGTANLKTEPQSSWRGSLSKAAKAQVSTEAERKAKKTARNRARRRARQRRRAAARERKAALEAKEAAPDAPAEDAVEGAEDKPAAGVEADDQDEAEPAAPAEPKNEAKAESGSKGKGKGEGKGKVATKTAPTSPFDVFISPANFKVIMGDRTVTSASSLAGQVGVVTTDFAMQNVILQLGLRLVSIDGMAIGKVKQFGKRCHACGAIELNAERIFCGTCGNQALIKVAIEVGANGKVKLRGGYRKNYNLRGTKYSIPKPKGGKKGEDMVLREDMLHKTGINWQRSGKKNSVLDPDVMTHFTGAKAKTKRYARSKIGYGKRNPNEWAKPKGR
ncbi:RNA-binding protein NOB1 [Thecamonas trahens ATCC 50062]|uniref:RNA-binding protein NOB1 n=1 Tax=Thecamonas trahens ATCC 50062 TaxID=461836 RepID=A0A0L0DFQ2_THETB|nr:RNA-binding protein NOB1 [Thecamonas trahens ATCC 50062]KNC51147.1 RNA-binding protein NOB1 [Thecamonas trahens ATCC 50062]|eukprot:XP_013756349.1 RNA-binding protein NOB1 [Thecamonas trahens ATCC 50062]